MLRESMFRYVDFKSHWLNRTRAFPSASPFLAAPRYIFPKQIRFRRPTNQSIFSVLLLFLCPYRSELECTFLCSLDE